MPKTTVRVSPDASRGRVTARPRQAPSTPLNAGIHTIPVPESRAALLYIPRAHEHSLLPLVVSLHGAGGESFHGIDILRSQADRHGFAILAPASRFGSWDVIAGGYGPDVMALDHSLAFTFDSVALLQDRIAISGFSDGASYALCLGLANGDLFPDIYAFSPGFSSPPALQGKPRIFISHGNRDTVLPIDSCSRVLVPKLRRNGYAVDYHEFNGPHTVPENIKEEAVEWWLHPVRSDDRKEQR